MSLHAYADVNDAAVKVKWSYVGTTGPSHWGMLSPDFEACDTGRAQSPINIGRKKTRVPFDLKIKYHPAPMIIGEDLETKLMIGKTQTIYNDGHSIQLNFNEKSKEFIRIGGKDYQLVQFHFHSPSETLWHKQDFPLEIHFVHESKDGDVAVVAVFVKGGADNSALTEILGHLPEADHVAYDVPDVSINPADLLPSDQRYYTFDGSLTTPPCTEGLKWIVMPQPITASPAQILRIRQESGGTNARPVQPMNDRALNYAVP
jgi:carbonic anhydrase